MFKRSIHSSSTPKRFERSRRTKTSPGRAHNNTGTNGNTAPPAAPTAKVNVEVFYVHPDHLGTPASTALAATTGTGITSPQTVNKAVWRWDSDPFGSNSTANSAPNENPNTLSQVVGTSTLPYLFGFDLAFPGQKRDRETGKHYNYFRDYDSAIGRYSESDRVGLKAGLSTFGYVWQQPTMKIDQFGLYGCRWVGLVLVCDIGPAPIPVEPGYPPAPGPVLPPFPKPNPISICAISPAACLLSTMANMLCRDNKIDCKKEEATCGPICERYCVGRRLDDSVGCWRDCMRNSCLSKECAANF